MYPLQINCKGKRTVGKANKEINVEKKCKRFKKLKLGQSKMRVGGAAVAPAGPRGRVGSGSPCRMATVRAGRVPLRRRMGGSARAARPAYGQYLRIGLERLQCLSESRQGMASSSSSCERSGETAPSLLKMMQMNSFCFIFHLQAMSSSKASL